MSVDTPELHAAARVHADAAERIGALAAALTRQAHTADSWSYGRLPGAVERFFTTLAWAAATGSAELADLARSLRAAADDYDLTEQSVARQDALLPPARSGEGDR